MRDKLWLCVPLPEVVAGLVETLLLPLISSLKCLCFNRVPFLMSMALDTLFIRADLGRGAGFTTGTRALTAQFGEP